MDSIFACCARKPPRVWPTRRNACRLSSRFCCGTAGVRAPCSRICGEREAARQRALAPTLDDETLRARVSEFVAWPGSDAPHFTGGAIDLTLADAVTGEPLAMGTEFDAFGPACALDFFDDLPTPNAKEFAHRRRLLADALRASDFVSYAAEWWHWEYGTARWARQTRRPRLYFPLLGDS